MFRFIFGKKKNGLPGFSAPRQRPKIRPELEALEDRLVPTVVFTPHFGPEAVSGGNHGLHNPTVNIIFSGNYWNSAQGQSNESAMLNAARSILSGPYLSGLTQYGSDGKASFGQSWNESWAVGSSAAEVVPFLEYAITDRGATHIDAFPWTNDPIYVVVSDPQTTAGSEMGWNSPGVYMMPNPILPPWYPIPEPIHMIWVGTNGGNVKDIFTDTLSHELAETISDPDPFGITVTPPSALPGWLKNGNQIGDNEATPTTFGYSYRLNGNLVQAYWSRHDNAFIVPDGNTQNFYLEPIWNTPLGSLTSTFSGDYNLSLQGDQMVGNINDVIRIDSAAGGGVKATLNGQAFELDNADGVIKTINVNMHTGSNVVQVAGVSPGATVNIDSTGWQTQSSNDLVIIGTTARTWNLGKFTYGPSSLAGIQGTINVNNSIGQTQMMVDWSNDPAAPGAVKVTDHSLVFSGFTLNYTGASRTKVAGIVHGVNDLWLIDGIGSNTMDFESVPALTTVTLWGNKEDLITGPAAGKVNIQRSKK